MIVSKSRRASQGTYTMLEVHDKILLTWRRASKEYDCRNDSWCSYLSKNGQNKNWKPRAELNRGESQEPLKGENELQLVHKQNKIIIWLDLVKTMVPKADPGPAHRGNPPTPLENVIGFVFLNFEQLLNA